MKIIKQIYWRRISQSEIRKWAAAESEGGQKFLPPNPLPFCPPERSVWRAKRAVNSVQNRFGLCHIIPLVKRSRTSSGARLFIFIHLSWRGKFDKIKI